MFKPLKSTNQSNQENFVLYYTKFKREGFYLEIGASDGVSINNTFVLEQSLKWKGVGIELEPSLCDLYNSNRINPCIASDATSIDYRKLMEDHNFPNYIDYLQVDIEPAHQSLQALKQVLKSGKQFGLITFEHDLYRNPDNQKIKLESFTLLKEYGYIRVFNDVKYDGLPFEDWYVNKNLFSKFRVYIFRLLLISRTLNLAVFFGQLITNRGK